MLNRIVTEIREKVHLDKSVSPIRFSEILPGNYRLSQALRQADWSLIAECKLASPSKGRFCQTYSAPELAKIYSTHGATALSVHTSAPFLGKIDDIAAVKAVTSLPILRKDFIIDEYQIYEARAAGADALLLIAAILTDAELNRFSALTHNLGMDALVEVHSRLDLERVQATTAALIGINNRDLTTFNTSVENTFNLLPHCKPGCLIISESGIGSKNEALRLKSAGIRGILVGEALVRSSDIAEKTRELALLQKG